MIESILVDATNFQFVRTQILEEVKNASLIGLDCETEDSNRHDGLNRFCGYNNEGKKPNNKPLVFDTRRTGMCGFSIHCDGSDKAYYFNLGHIDAENRLPTSVVKDVLDQRGPEAYFIAHNAPFELVMFENCVDYKLDRIVCTLQMAVSAYGPDEYSMDDFKINSLSGMRELKTSIMGNFLRYTGGRNFNAEQGKVFGQITGKESKAAHSYNGFVKKMVYGYALKTAVESHFGVKMQTFDETLNGKAHMGQLTGAEAGLPYGCDDAYWCLRLFKHLLAYMVANRPETVDTFFKQENPMIHVYANAWKEGMKINFKNIGERRDFERKEFAQGLRELKKALKPFLPFNKSLAPQLDCEPWYAKNGESYRRMLTEFILSPDEDDFKQVHQIRSPVSKAWAAEHELPESSGINLTYYMSIRVLYYDLLELEVLKSKGKVQSDKGARAKLIDKAAANGQDQIVEVLRQLGNLTEIDTRMKLYLNPYHDLVDPETGHIYPVLSSMLATRRMATSYPNPMQLSKRGQSTYVRGFYEADHPDWLIVAADWSAVELVIIGEVSGDPEFEKAYKTEEHGDLHAGAAADCLGFDEDVFMSLKTMDSIDQYLEMYGEAPSMPLVDAMGNSLTPNKFYSMMRGNVGKGANFNYWYSGALSSVGDKLDWTSEQMWEATERYRTRFGVAEEWRQDTIARLCKDGHIILPDGHYRTKFEATQPWAIGFWQKWIAAFGESKGVQALGREVMKAIISRSKNQGVNAVVQGTCATLAKRSILTMDEKMDHKWSRFMVPVHDELVYSVHKDYASEFIPMLKKKMCDHPEIISNLTLAATCSIGKTFEQYHPEKAPFGQIELDEAPSLPNVIPEELRGKKLNSTHTSSVINYLSGRV